MLKVVPAGGVNMTESEANARTPVVLLLDFISLYVLSMFCFQRRSQIVCCVCVCVCVCVFIKLHITAQSGPVIYSFYATACNPPGGYLS